MVLGVLQSRPLITDPGVNINSLLKQTANLYLGLNWLSLAEPDRFGERVVTLIPGCVDRDADTTDIDWARGGSVRKASRCHNDVVSLTVKWCRLVRHADNIVTIRGCGGPLLDASKQMKCGGYSMTTVLPPPGTSYFSQPLIF